MDNRPLEKVHIFGDESSHKGKSNFLVYGIVSCREHRLDGIARKLEFSDFGHEFHWKKSGRSLDEHKRFVAALFNCIWGRNFDNPNKDFQFRCIVVNRRHMNNREFNDSDPDKALEKYIYRQLLNTALNSGPNVRFHVTLDEGREKRFPPEAMKDMLNSGYKKENDHGFTHEPFESVRVLSSKKSRFVQAADVLSGAVAWVWNKRYNDPDKGEGKEALAGFIARLLNIPIDNKLAKARGVPRKHYLTLGYETLKHAERGFSIWDFDLRAEERKEQMTRSAEQLAAIVDPNITFANLLEAKYKVWLECAYCKDRILHSLTDPRFKKLNSLRIQFKQRPMCEECGRPRVALLEPDPRYALLALVKKPQ